MDPVLKPDGEQNAGGVSHPKHQCLRSLPPALSLYIQTELPEALLLPYTEIKYTHFNRSGVCSIVQDGK